MERKYFTERSVESPEAIPQAPIGIARNSRMIHSIEEIIFKLLRAKFKDLN